ncbi:MAG: glycosyltransferase family 39 protein, partial [Thermoflexales bacterium]|nr:glycosyltransferase family 39 protein [Thermoflexales bacterium]
MKVALRVIRVALIAGAIALAIFAQRTIQNLSLGAQTLPLFAAAIGLLFVSSIGVQAAPRLRRADDEAPAFETLSRGQSLLWLASALFMVAGIVFFTRGAMNASGTAWLLHGAGMLLFALAFLPFQDVLTRFRRWRKAPEIVVDPEAILAVLLFVVVVGLALWLRMQALGDFPEGVWYDEGANGLVARQILDDPGYRPVYVDITQLPAHWDYVIAATLRLFGDNIGGLRMAPALFGVVAVAFLFLLLRRWFNTPLAFLGAACLAVMRYSLTFSRFGLNGMPSVTFEIMTLYFLDRAVRGRRLSDFALAGLTLGMGLNFYYAFRIFAGVVVGFGALWVLWLLIRRVVFRRGSAARPDARGALRAWSVPLLIAVFGIAIAISPIAQFGVRFPAQFFQRTSTVSIFEKRDEPDLVKALTGNITKHLLMFNVRGDGNGRHNLPGEPMLDPLMAALAALGFGYALLNIRNPRNLFMVLTFLGMLAGGILSIDFEAPQAYRSIGVLAALPYFIILPLGALKEALGALFTGLPARRVAQGLVYAAGLAGVVVAGQANVTAFFDRQRYATDTWLPQSTPETFAAREMVRLAPNFDLVVSTQFAGHPSVRFEAPDAKNYKIFSANDLLLPAFTPGRGVAYLLDLSLTPAYEQLRRYFPNAETRLLTPPRGGGPYAYSVAISPEDILAALGARASLFPGGRFDAAPAQTLDTPTLSANWATAAPVEGAFGAELNTTLNAPRAANYRFAVNGGEGGQVFVDGFPVPAAGLDLAEGNHALRVRLPNARTAFEVTWLIGNNGGFQPIPQSALLRPPITNSGLQGSYFRSPDWTGAPAIRRLDPTIAFYFHNIPLPRPYTVRWEGKVFAPVPGTYRFTTQSIDESLLEIDGKTVIENRGTNQRVDGTLTLTTGWHDIVLRFADRTSYTQVYLYWAPPGGAYEIIPSNVLRPPMGEYPSVEAMQALLAEAAKPAPAGSVKQVTAAAASEGLPRLRPPEL